MPSARANDNPSAFQILNLGLCRRRLWNQSLPALSLVLLHNVFLFIVVAIWNAKR